MDVKKRAKKEESRTASESEISSAMGIADQVVAERRRLKQSNNGRYGTSGWWIGGEGRVQVRTTRRREPAALVLLEEDADDKVYALVSVHDLPTVVLLGWCWGKDGKKERNVQISVGDNPCYVIPVEELRPVHELRALLDDVSQSHL